MHLNNGLLYYQNILQALPLLFPVLVYLVWLHSLHKKDKKKLV